MALNSTQYTNYVATPPLKVRSQDWHGRVRVAYADFTASALAGGSANGCVNMVLIPAGSRILDGRLFWEALGQTATSLFVGDQFVCNRFMLVASGQAASNNLSSQGDNCGRFNSTPGAAQTNGNGYLCTCDTTIIFSLGSGNATGLIQLEVFYSTE